MSCNAKEKDRELAKYYNSAGSWDCFGTTVATSILLGDGYLEKISPCSGKTTSTIIQITDKGRAFYLNGGYSGATAAKKRESRKEFIKNIFTAIIGAIFGFIAGLLANIF